MPHEKLRNERLTDEQLRAKRDNWWAREIIDEALARGRERDRLITELEEADYHRCNAEAKFDELRRERDEAHDAAVVYKQTIKHVSVERDAAREALRDLLKQAGRYQPKSTSLWIACGKAREVLGDG